MREGPSPLQVQENDGKRAISRKYIGPSVAVYPGVHHHRADSFSDIVGLAVWCRQFFVVVQAEMRRIGTSLSAWRYVAHELPAVVSESIRRSLYDVSRPVPSYLILYTVQ